jgi:hypothetical protein
MPDYMPQPPAYVPTRADALQNQPPAKWLTLRTDDLLVDAAFVVAYDLPLTPDSRAALAGTLRSRGYQLSPLA